MKPYYRPHDLERCWTFVTVYKEQFIVFYSVNAEQLLPDESSPTLRLEDQRFKIKHIPESVQIYSNDIVENIKKLSCF